MSFADDIFRWAAKTNKGLADVQSGVLMEICTRLMRYSPVGDASYWKHKPPKGYTGGHFRVNWQYGFEEAVRTEVSGVDKTGTATLSNINRKIVPMPAIHYITNNVPYAQRLEDGWSRQAPAGVVSRVQIEFRGIVDIQANKVRSANK